jgi:hypothetical protein
MNPADETAAKIVPPQGQSPAAVVSSHDELDEQVEDLLRPGDQPKPGEDLHELFSVISRRLDHESSQQKAIYDRLVAIENQTKRRGSRGLARFLLAICIGVAGTLAWQSYGDSAKQIIVTRASELGWSPEAKQMIANWMQQLGWTKPPAVENTAVRPSGLETPQAATVAQTAPEPVAPKAPTAPSLDPEPMQQITRSLTTLQQTVWQLAAGQDRMAREMARLESDLVDILVKTPGPPPQRREGR